MADDLTQRLVKPDELRLARQFGALARGNPQAIRLDLCCLLIGRIVDPAFDQLEALTRLEQLAGEARADTAASVSSRIERLCAVLFEERGFRGDTDTYYEPHNCCLHATLENGRGMPITLAVLMIEVGRRVGLELQGVGAPFHFIVKYHDPDDGREHFLDPFRGGREIDRDALFERLNAMHRGVGPEPESFLAAVTKRQMLQRILTNLKGAAVRKRDYQAAISATDFLLALSPWSLEDRRDRGLLCYQTGQFIEALDDLQQYHEHAADAPDAERVAEFIERVRVRIAEGSH
ncbi:MAG: transglutaminase-like domain-containing protein [Chloroflexi bacterium]|nr:transglutaminase-like domain-containing protein [Chloroflexota bacterium]MCY3696484.1 transglutaminase-like domain-containing protein [Chloroflexota bacterium]MYD16209.1 tetratricopeptide repeat protein [Chloroflexota bacterium]MYJ01766.1 tetratricopeptide repeat protein [Chloroflexota bacterium]